MTKRELASYIDHTLLTPYAVKSDVLRLCEEALKYGFASVCVNPRWVPIAAARLAGADVAVCTVVGFPLGASAQSVKAYEARHAVYQGAKEIDMVIDVGALKDGDIDAVESGIRCVAEACRDAGKKTNRSVVVKAIIETCYLTDEEKLAACRAAENAGADFVKTSTGFGSPPKGIPSGAAVEDVALIRNALPASMSVKASGGIRRADFALQLIKAGASRLGVSCGTAIIDELQE